MKHNFSRAIAVAIPVATIVASCLLTSCEGRKMSNMVPKGETVEVVVPDADTPDFTPDSIQTL